MDLCANKRMKLRMFSLFWTEKLFNNPFCKRIEIKKVPITGTLYFKICYQAYLHFDFFKNSAASALPNSAAFFISAHSSCLISYLHKPR